MEPGIEIDGLARAAIGAAIEVHRELGPGYLESVYEEALATELIGNCLVVEIKAVDSLAPIHKAQVMSYLKATKQRLGLLINFNERFLKSGIQRIIWSEVVES